MVMAMDVACIRAPAVHRELALKRRLPGTARIAPSRIAAERANWRPVRHRWGRYGLVMASKVTGRVDNPSTNDGQVGCCVGDVVLRAGEIIAVRHDEVGELAVLDAALLAFLVGEPGDVLGPHPQGGLPVEAIALRID